MFKYVYQRKKTVVFSLQSWSTIIDYSVILFMPVLLYRGGGGLTLKYIYIMGLILNKNTLILCGY